jgi:tripartite ATP-independent transporter DctM subunit
MSALFVLSLIVFAAAGTALAHIVGALGVLAFWVTDNLRYLAVMPQRIFSQLDVFSLMAMPFFIMAGEIMNQMNVTKALVDFSMSIVGRFKGGLGHVNIMSSVFFAGVSGSAVADSAALSSTLVPAMRQQGYTSRYAAAVTVASSVIGPIIPPSIILIFYGALMQTSVGALFAAGLFPGLLMAAALMVFNGVVAHQKNHPGGKGYSVPPFLPGLKKALPALALPFIILGGIVFGIVTPTEAGALAVIAALGAGWIYGKLNWSVFYDCLKRTSSVSGMIFIVMAASACTAYIGSLEQWPQRLAALATDSGLTGIEFLFAVNLVFLIAGMLMDAPMALFLLVPLFGPPCVAMGFDPTHLGIILCLNITMGLITPPIGACLIIVSSITGENYWKLSWAVLPFALIEIGVLFLIILFPELSLYLPRMMGLL